MNDHMPHINDLLGQHPARRMDFDTLYNGLMDMKSKRLVNARQHGTLEIFTYTQNAVYEREWNIFTMISRGLILEPATKKVIATPFPKFFNYGENDNTVPPVLCDDSVIYEKLDGSLGIIYFHDGEWQCATKGSFISSQAKWAKDWINNHPYAAQLQRGHTYLFEIIYPENKIIVNYDYEGLVLLSAYCDMGHEYSHSDIRTLSEQSGIRAADTFNYSDISTLLDEAKIIDKNNEGWVVRFSNGYRLKIKGDEYIRIHRLLTHITPLGVWNLMLAQDNLNDMRHELPEEHLKDFDMIVKLLNDEVNALIEEVIAAKNRLESFDDKTLGLAIKSEFWPDGSPITEVTRKFLFTARKTNFLADINDKTSATREKIYRFIKPSANMLKGYTPTDAMNRFTEEAAS